MRSLLTALAILLVLGCSSTSEPTPEPSFEEQHVSPHLGQCHPAFGESQGWGVIGAPCQAG